MMIINQMTIAEADEVMKWAFDIYKHSKHSCPLVTFVDLIAKCQGRTVNDVLHAYAIAYENKEVKAYDEVL